MDGMMEPASRASQGDCSAFISSSPKEGIADSSSKEKKILPGRRQQRHSTEIGAEYHRWWVVRNALGFETNEHIAGLLLDGFHGLVQHLVILCGGEVYQPSLHGGTKTNLESNDGSEEVTPTPSPTSSTSPPGVVEDMEEFTEYKNAITHYCDSLWRICGQQDNRLRLLDKLSPTVQEFLMRFMGYLRAAKGKTYSLSHKKKRFKPVSATVKKSGEGNPPDVGIGVLGPPSSCPASDKPVSSSASTSSLALIPVQDSPGLATSSQTLFEHLGWRDPVLSPSLQSSKQEPHEDKVPEHIKVDSARVERIPGSQWPLSDTESAYAMLGGSTSTYFHQGKELITTHCHHSPSQSLDVLPCEKPAHLEQLNQSLAQQQQQQLSQSPQQECRDLPQQEKATQHQQLLPWMNFQTHNLRSASKPQTSHLENDQLQIPDFREQLCQQNGQHLRVGQTIQKEQWQQQPRLVDIPLEWGGRQSSSCPVPCKDVSPDSSWSSTEEYRLYEDSRTARCEKDGRSIGQDDVASGLSEGISSSMDTVEEQEYKDKDNFGHLSGTSDFVIHCTNIDTDNGKTSKSVSSTSPPTLSGKKEMTNPHSLPGKILTQMPLSSSAASDRRAQGVQTNISLFPPFGQAGQSGLKASKSHSLFLPQTGSMMVKISDTNPAEVNQSLHSDGKHLTTAARQSQSSHDMRHQKVVIKEPLPVLQPALLSSGDQSTGFTAPLGTPVILYPANSFAANDNSLASLSSLVQNIVYNSHGTILKPLSLTPITSLPSSTTSHLSVPHLPTTISTSSTPKKPIAATLPVLSSQLSASRPTLVPFYISHTAMNTFNNLPKAANFTGIPHTSLTSSGSQTVTPDHLQSQQLSTPHIISVPYTKSYQDWSPDVKTTFCSDVSSDMNQLKITDVRSCSDTDFTNIGNTLNENSTSQGPDSTGTQSQMLSTVTSSGQNWTSKTGLAVSGQRLSNAASFPHSSLFMNITTDSGCHGLSGQRLDYLYNHTAGPVATSSSHTTGQSGVYGRYDQAISSSGESLVGSQAVVNQSETLVTCSSGHTDQQKTSSKPSRKILSSLLSRKTSDYSRGPAITSITSITSLLSQINTTSSEPVADAVMLQSQPSKSLPGRTGIYSGSQGVDQCGRNDLGKPRQGKDSAVSSSVSKSSSSSHKSSRSRRLVCSTCDLLFFSGTDLLVHRYEQHSHVCGECDGRFLSATRLKQHKETDHPSMVRCSLCRFHTFNRETLAEHTWSQHGARIPTVEDVNVNHAHKKDREPSTFTKDENLQEIKEQFERPVSGAARSCCAPEQCKENTEISTSGMTGRPITASPTGCIGGSSSQLDRADDCDKVTTTFRESETSGKDGELVSGVSVVTSHASEHHRQERKSEGKLCGDHDSSCVNNEPGHSRQSLQQGEETCSGPVFPSLTRETGNTFRPDLDTISAMYSQVSQHCHLDTTEFLNLSEQQFSETDEPRLVIDTDFGNIKQDCPETETVEGDTKANDASEEPCQPLCLVMHRRGRTADGSKGTSALNAGNMRHRRKACHVRGHPQQSQDSSEAKDVTDQKSATSLSFPGHESGSELKTDLKQRSSFPKNEGREDKSPTGKAMDLSKTSEREKLVMKISLKRSARTMEVCDSECPKKKRRRRRRGCRRTGFLATESPVVEIDNPEDNSDNYYISNDSLDPAQSIICDKLHDRHELASSRADNKEALEVSSSSLTVDESVQMKGNSSVLIGENSKHNLQHHGTRIPSTSHPPQGENSKCKQVKPGDGITTPRTNRTCEPERQEKGLSLRDRHVMSSLPPKKRNFRKSPRSCKEESGEVLASIGEHVPRSYTFNNPVRRHSDSLPNTASSNTHVGRDDKIPPVSKSVSPHRRRTRAFLNKCPQNRQAGNSIGAGSCVSGRGSNSKSKYSSASTAAGLTSTLSSDAAGSSGLIESHYTCPMFRCKATFSRKWTLDGHMARVHSKHIFLPCTVLGCDLKFPSRKDLRQHVTMDHKGKVRKYKCSWPDCNKGFFARTHLRIHTLTHTGEKPVACQICEYRCRQRTALMWHMRKHGVFHQPVKTKCDGSNTA